MPLGPHVEVQLLGGEKRLGGRGGGGKSRRKRSLGSWLQSDRDYDRLERDPMDTDATDWGTLGARMECKRKSMCTGVMERKHSGLARKR